MRDFACFLVRRGVRREMLQFALFRQEMKPLPLILGAATRFRVTRASAVSRKRAAVPLSAEISQGAETSVSSRAGRSTAA